MRSLYNSEAVALQGSSEADLPKLTSLALAGLDGFQFKQQEDPDKQAWIARSRSRSINTNPRRHHREENSRGHKNQSNHSASEAEDKSEAVTRMEAPVSDEELEMHFLDAGK